jgi:hypothetical protein
MSNEQNNDKVACDANKPCCESGGVEQKQPCGEKNVFAETMKEGMSKVFSGMKTMVAVALVGLCAITGCKSLPTVDKIESVSRLAGTSAAMVVNMTKIDEQSKAVIIEIMDKVELAVPQTNQTFTEVWTPIAKEYVAKMVADGKIDEGQGQLILSGFTIACNGIDYVFDVRYPKARQYKELVEAAVHGFIAGYKSVSPSVSLKSGGKAPDYDKEVYNYLKVKAGL